MSKYLFAAAAGAVLFAFSAVSATNLSRNSTKNRYQESKALRVQARVTLNQVQMSRQHGARSERPPCRRLQKLASKMIGCNLAEIPY
jgi:hypothetical protein